MKVPAMADWLVHALLHPAGFRSRDDGWGVHPKVHPVFLGAFSWNMGAQRTTQSLQLSLAGESNQKRENDSERDVLQ